MEPSEFEHPATLAASGEPSQMISLRRRDFLALATAGAAAASPLAALAAESSPFPKGFLWGAATAAHQVEGNNINSDLWVLEHLKPTIFAEPSGDACDHYHRYADDIKMLAGLGFNISRSSIGGARSKRERAFFPNPKLDHSRRVLAPCHENKVQPM